MIDVRALIGLIAPIVFATACFDEAGTANGAATTASGTTTADTTGPGSTTGPATATGTEATTGAASSGPGPESTTGNGSSSSTSSTATSADSSSGSREPVQILLYATQAQHDGNLLAAANRPDPRAAADALCDDDPNRPAECGDVVAVITIDNDDTIRNLSSQSGLPEALPVFSPAGELVAQSWTNMVADLPVLVVSLQTAMVTSDLFWTGTEAAGGPGPNCSAWASAAPSPTVGRRGNPTVLDAGWFGGGNNGPCDVSAPLLCACW